MSMDPIDRLTQGACRTTLTCAGLRVRAVRYPPGLVMEPHSHEAASVTLVLRGGFFEDASGASQAIKSGALVVKPCRTVHAGKVGRRGADTLVFESLEDPRGPLGVQSLEYGVIAALEVTAAALELRSSICERRRESKLRQNLVDLGRAVCSTRERPDPTRGRTWVHEARKMLDDLPDAGQFSAISDHIGVHPATLAREFRKRFGLSMTEYVRTRRMFRAASRVADPEVPLANAAVEVGFSDQSHMNRAFRSQFGMTPRQFRKAAKEPLA